MEAKDKHTTLHDIESDCVLTLVLEYLYKLQSINAVNLNKINNIFNNLNLVIVQSLSKN